MERSSSLRTPIKRARGLGSAHTGTRHFWVQRGSAVLLLPLSAWFVITIATRIFGGDRAAIVVWLKNPVTALALVVFIVALFVHARLGVQTIIEDYIHHEGKKIAALLLLNACVVGFGAAALMAVAHLHFFGIK